MKNILMIDNYDSFTFNLVQYLDEMGCVCDVHRNDDDFLKDLLKGDSPVNKKYKALVISPGPCTPNESGLSCEMIGWAIDNKVAVLGVCLGHQCIAKFYGAKIVRAKRIFHGKVSKVSHDGRGVFTNLENPLEVARYHSLAIKKETMPDFLEISALDERKEIMAIRHKKLPIVGIQFHPESIATKSGKILLRNFFDYVVSKKQFNHLKTV